MLCLVSCDRIEGNFNFPVMFRHATKATGNRQLELRFQLPAKSNMNATSGGITFGQFIGVRFQSGLFDFSSNLAPTVTLTSGTTTYTVAFVAPVVSPITATNTADGNVLYVQYLDRNIQVLPAKTNLVLTIMFPTALSLTFVHNIGIFTSTSNNRDQVIIDNLPSIGNFGLYRDYTLDDNNKILIINNSGSSLSTIVSPSQVGGNTTLYPGFTINISFRIELQQYWIFNAQDMIMHIKYATKSFSYPTSVTTSAFSSAANEGALSESLNLIEVSDGIIISGFVNNLVFPRKFVMSLNGVKTTDFDIGLSTNLECQIFYRNTYSIISYSRIAMDVIKVIPLQDAKVFHPDYFPIFDGMGWPFQFQFRSNVEISTGGYVVIRQRDYARTTQAVTLVASSCDFSLTNLEQNFGKRFNCLPLRNDFAYEVVADTLEANGIFFRMPTIISSTTDTYKIRVWGFVERCFNSANATDSFYRELTFTIRIFKNAGINDTFKNESLFPVTNQSTSTNYVLAESTSVKHQSRCYPLPQRNVRPVDIATDVPAITKFTAITAGTNMFQIDPVCNHVLTSKSTECDASDNLHAVGIEVYNIHVLGVPSTLTSLTTLGSSTFFARFGSVLGVNATVGGHGFTEKYIFSSTSDIANTSVFFYSLIATQHNSGGHVPYDLVDYIPSECITNAALMIITNVEASYRWIFNRQWFSVGNINYTGTADGCQLNWEFYHTTTSPAVANPLPNTIIFINNLRHASGVGLGSPALLNGRRTTMTTKTLSVTQGVGTATMNANVSADHTTKTNAVSVENEIFFRITSTLQTPGVATSLSIWGGDCTVKHVAEGTDPTNNITSRIPFAFYSDCIKWSSKPSNATWLFSYFDVQLQMMNKNVNPLRIIRFIKLYPEMGLFQDPTINDSDTSITTATIVDYQKWINIHFTPTWSGSTPFNVCLIEITSNIIDKTKQNSSNTIIMWLFATSLLDLDPSNETFEYPVAPLPSSTAYGNNSGQTISANFRKVGDTSSATVSIPTLDATDGTASILPAISELEMLFYKLVFHATVGATANSQARSFLPTFEARRTTYQLFMGSVIYIPTTNNPSGNVNINLFVPILCPTYSAVTASGNQYPTNGIYFTNPIVTLAWAQMSSYNNISRIDTYIRPVGRALADIVKNTDFYTATANWSYQFTDGTATPTVKYPISNLLTKSAVVASAGIYSENGNPKSALGGTTAQYPTNRKESFSDLKIQFRAYTKITNNEQNILDLTTLVNSLTSSIMIFLSPKINDISSTGVTGNPNIAANLDKTFKYKKTNNLFYILGLPFNKFLAWGFEDPDGVMKRETTIGSTYLFTMSTNFVIPITGIPRLDITHYENAEVKKTNYFNYVAVFTASNHGFDATSSNNKIQTNLTMNESSGTLATFIGFKLYLPVLDDTTSWNPQIREDDTDNFITNEKSANINVSGTFPTLIPRGTYVKLSFDNSIISTVTKCGLIENGKTNIVTDCDISSSDVSCPFTKNATTFEICCYNINNDNAKITVDRAEVNFNLTLTGFSSSSYLASTTASLANHTSDVFYKRPSASEISASAKFAQLVFTSRIVTDLSSANANFFSSLTTLRYYLSSTINGIGLGHFIIRLPRSATRGMTLTLITNLTALKPNNLRTRILPTFGNSLLYGSNYDNGDAFIDSAYSDFSTNGIILRLKNMVYKCNIKLSNTLNIFVWPIFTPNIVNQTVKITLKGADNSDIANSNNHNITSTPSLTLTLVEENTLADFCKITNVDPRLPSSYAEYTFSFSFQQTSSKIETSGVTGNEILIFFDHIAYGDEQNVLCYNENNLLQCSFIEDSILSIRFNNINTSGDATQIVRIVGIINPHIQTNNNGIFFGCAMASTNFITDTRRYMIKGVASIVEGIDPKNETTYGNIIYKNSFIFHRINIPNSNQTTTGIIEGSAQGEEALNPLESPNLLVSSWENSYTISFSLDVANRMISNWENGFTLGSGIEIYLTLPDEFKLHYYSLSNLRATLVGFRMNELNQSVIEMVNFDTSNASSAETSVKVTEIKVVGNQLRMKLNLTNLVFSKFFQYFTLKLFNIPPPENNTSDTSTGKITTKAIEIIVMNTARTQIFRTWSNLNNWSQHDILVNKINDFLPRNKGLKFEFDQKKWVIDAIDKTGSTIILNELTINSGRYSTYFFRVRNTTRLLEPKLAKIVLINNRLRFDKPTIDVATYRFADIQFKIGIPCNENPGYMISRPFIQTVPTENIYNFFMPLANLIIRIKNESVALVMSPVNIDVRINGSTFVDFTVLEAPVEDININFLPSSQSEILNSRLLSNTFRIRTIFRMLDKQTDTQQSFNLPILDSNCYDFKEDKIVFLVNKVAAIIPNSALKTDMFTYLNSETESTITPNTVAFRFTSVYSQIYMYAVLTCYDFEFPTIDQMKNNNITQSETLRFFYEVLNNEGTFLISFKNVLRGYPMKMRVFIESTQGVLSERTASDNIIILNSTLSNGTVTPIIATRTRSPRCASYQFKTRPGVQVTNPLLWYWQRRFSLSGYFESGCISAVDQYGTEIPGLPSIRNETNCGTARCRFIDRPSFVVNATQLAIPETYTICAYPLSYCETDPTNYQETFNEIMVTLSNNQTFNNTLNTRVVPEFVLVEVDDNQRPESPLISDIKSTTNSISFSATSNKPIRCFARISNQGAPTDAEFNTCNSNNCKVLEISKISSSYTFSGLTQGSYTIYSKCYNDMHCSQSTSGVLSLGSGTVTSPTNNTNTTNNNTNPIYSKFINISLILLIMLFILLE